MLLRHLHTHRNITALEVADEPMSDGNYARPVSQSVVRMEMTWGARASRAGSVLARRNALLQFRIGNRYSGHGGLFDEWFRRSLRYRQSQKPRFSKYCSMSAPFVPVSLLFRNSKHGIKHSRRILTSPNVESGRFNHPRSCLRAPELEFFFSQTEFESFRLARL
jgi:hypothetical protein